MLKETGSLFVHCDRNASHYLKVLLDQIFGMNQIQKESETLEEAVSKLCKSSKSKKCIYMILIRTHLDFADTDEHVDFPGNLFIMDAYDLTIQDFIEHRKDAPLQFSTL